MHESTFKLLTFNPPKDDFERRHNHLVLHNENFAWNSVESSVLQMVDALNRYGRMFKKLSWNEDGTGPGMDGYAHEYFRSIAYGVNKLLSIGMESNTLHCGKINSALISIMKDAGFSDHESEDI